MSKRPAEDSGNFGYEHFHIHEVDGRSWILIHAGNFTSQILGCILVGVEHRDFNGDGITDITNSRETLRKLLDHTFEELPIQVFSW